MEHNKNEENSRLVLWYKILWFSYCLPSLVFSWFIEKQAIDQVVSHPNVMSTRQWIEVDLQATAN